MIVSALWKIEMESYFKKFAYRSYFSCIENIQQEQMAFLVYNTIAEQVRDLDSTISLC